LKLDFKKWNEEVYGNVERNKRKLIEDLQAFDVIEESRALWEEELLRKAEVVRDLEIFGLLVLWVEFTKSLLKS
jgi:hypothetical protein